MNAPRLRIKRQGHRSGGEEGFLEIGKELGRQEAEQAFAEDIKQLRLQHTVELRTQRQRHETERELFRRREEAFRVTITDLEEQVERSKAAFSGNQTMTAEPSTQEQEKGTKRALDQLEHFRASNLRTGGVPIEEIHHGWPVFKISDDAKLFVSSEVRKFLPDDRLGALACSVQALYQTALHTGRIATIVTDPIAYYRQTGVFVKGGTVKDAAVAISSLKGKNFF